MLRLEILVRCPARSMMGNAGQRETLVMGSSSGGTVSPTFFEKVDTGPTFDFLYLFGRCLLPKKARYHGIWNKVDIAYTSIDGLRF